MVSEGSAAESVHHFTGRNEVVAKVIFLHLFVILFTGECLPQCMLGYPPPRSRHPPEKTPR